MSSLKRSFTEVVVTRAGRSKNDSVRKEGFDSILLSLLQLNLSLRRLWWHDFVYSRCVMSPFSEGRGRLYTLREAIMFSS